MDVRRSFYLMPRSKSVAVAQMYDGEAVWPDGTLRQAIRGLLCHAVTSDSCLIGARTSKWVEILCRRGGQGDTVSV